MTAMTRLLLSMPRTALPRLCAAPKVHKSDPVVTPGDAGDTGGVRLGQWKRPSGWRRVLLWKSPYDQKIFELAGPTLLTLAADPLLSIVDTIYVGRLGSPELGALGVNTAVFSLAFLVFNFLAVATTPLVASSIAAGEKEKAGQATTQAFLLAMLLGVPLLFALDVFVDPILAAMGATPDVLGPSKDYLLTRAIAAPAALLCLSGQGVFRGLQDTRTPLAITICANALNFVLDPVLIYGFGLGVKGAALSTAFAEITSAMAYCGLLWRRRSDVGLDCSILEALDRAKASYLPFLENAGTVVLRTGVLLGSRTLASAVAAHLGAISIAAHQVLFQLWLLHQLLSDSLAIAGQSIVATELAKKTHRRRARRVSDRLLQLSAYLGCVMAVAYAVGYPFLPHIFTGDDAVVDAVDAVLPLTIVMLPINSVAYGFDGILIGARDFDFIAKGMAVSSAGACGALFLVKPLEGGLLGIWLSLSLLMVLRFAICNARYQQRDGPVPPIV